MTDISKLAQAAVDDSEGYWTIRQWNLSPDRLVFFDALAKSLWAAGYAAGIRAAIEPLPPPNPQSGVIEPLSITAVPRKISFREIQPVERAATPLVVEYDAPAALPAAEPTPEEEAENQDQGHGEDGR